MKYDPDIHHRRSIRLRDYDYAREGAYFVTVCVQGRECLFGKVNDWEVVPSEAGRMVEDVLKSLPERFSAIALDEYVVMPNHLHAIIVIVGAPLVGAQDLTVTNLAGKNRAGTRPAPTLGDIIGAFKSLTTNDYIRGVNEHGWPPFPGRLWQRNYYERVIRDEDEMERARRYIQENPARWETDDENSGVVSLILQ